MYISEAKNKVKIINDKSDNQYFDGLTPEDYEAFYNYLHEEAIRVGYKVCTGE